MGDGSREVSGNKNTSKKVKDPQMTYKWRVRYQLSQRKSRLISNQHKA